MTPKRERFCEEYLVDLNGTQAAIRAGYSKKTANEQAARLLADVSVSAKISELRKQVSDGTKVTIEGLIADLVEIKDRCMQKVPVMEFDREAKRYVQAVDDEGRGVWTFDARNALEAIEKLGRHLGMFPKDGPPKDDGEERRFTVSWS